MAILTKETCSQYNPHKNYNVILYRSRKKNLKIHLETQDLGLFSLKGKKCYYTPFEVILHDHRVNNSIVLAQRQKQRSVNKTERPDKNHAQLQPPDF